VYIYIYIYIYIWGENFMGRHRRYRCWQAIHLQVKLGVALIRALQLAVQLLFHELQVLLPGSAEEATSIDSKL
jgi:hypothetical protein